MSSGHLAAGFLSAQNKEAAAVLYNEAMVLASLVTIVRQKAPVLFSHSLHQ